eukprot:scaffold625_cov420-Prasinococcus_capsulatus_cf.AAC.36
MLTRHRSARSRAGDCPWIRRDCELWCVSGLAPEGTPHRLHMCAMNGHEAKAIKQEARVEEPRAAAEDVDSSPLKKQRRSCERGEVLVCELSRMRRVTVQVYRGVPLVRCGPFLRTYPAWTNSAAARA